jgi:queuine tRNA-ribosyltransferase
MFDCVMPARNGRHGHLFTWRGVLNINTARCADDASPIDPVCGCPVCRTHSRAYLRHLFKSGEMLGLRLAVYHNLWFYNSLMARIRRELDAGAFDAFRRDFGTLLSARIQDPI